MSGFLVSFVFLSIIDTQAAGRDLMNLKMILLSAVVVLPVLSVLASGSRTNPAVENEVQWDSPKTKELFFRACADCHSFETRWPWYSHIAPISWLVIGHVNDGREEFNISAKKIGEADEAAEHLEEGEMPLPGYVLLHPEADLSKEDKAALVEGLKNTFGVGDDDHDHDDHDDDHGDDHD